MAAGAAAAGAAAAEAPPPPPGAAPSPSPSLPRPAPSSGRPRSPLTCVPRAALPAAIAPPPHPGSLRRHLVFGTRGEQRAGAGQAPPTPSAQAPCGALAGLAQAHSGALPAGWPNRSRSEGLRMRLKEGSRGGGCAGP
nr:PREDICTED: translation initiation factor IF-2-like [Anolis carolinensis]|eukprot:XP_016853720.1 PREDICTED: translation initiation factor IF-2-like [Anolis carolinensis]